MRTKVGKIWSELGFNLSGICHNDTTIAWTHVRAQFFTFGLRLARHLPGTSFLAQLFLPEYELKGKKKICASAKI